MNEGRVDSISKAGNQKEEEEALNQEIKKAGMKLNLETRNGAAGMESLGGERHGWADPRGEASGEKTNKAARHGQRLRSGERATARSKPATVRSSSLEFQLRTEALCA